VNTTEGNIMKDKTPRSSPRRRSSLPFLQRLPSARLPAILCFGKNSVGAAQLKKNAVTGKKIAKNAVTGAQNGWVNYSLSGNSAGYYKDRLGFVHLKGMIKNGTMSATALTLPAGYRLARALLLPTASAHVYGEVLLYADGRVDPEIGFNLLISLDGIVFRAT
jgi:hypothetical protein